MGEVRAHEAICPYHNNPGAPQRLRAELDEVLAQLTANSQVVFMHAAQYFALNNKMERTGEGDSYKLQLFRDWAIGALDEQLDRIRKFKSQLDQVAKTMKIPFPLDLMKRKLSDLIELQKNATEVVEELKTLGGD